MAAIALNKFRTIRTRITSNSVGIYTCPIGVASIIINWQITNVSTGSSTGIASVTALHARDPDPITGIVSFKLANSIVIPQNDGYNIVGDGRLALETNDILYISASENWKLEGILSVLETAKQ
jgi:hypothetical protein